MIILVSVLFFIIQIGGSFLMKSLIPSYTLTYIVPAIVANLLGYYILNEFGGEWDFVFSIYGLLLSGIILLVMFIIDLSLLLKQKGVKYYNLKTIGFVILLILLFAGYTYINGNSFINTAIHQWKYILTIIGVLMLTIAFQIKADSSINVKDD